MKANELRIGNHYLYDGVEHQVAELRQNYAHCYLDGCKKAFSLRELHFYSQIKPIPLTEEWLLKFGFEVYNVSGSSFTHRKKGKFCIWSNGYNAYFDYQHSYDIDSVKLEYVHQLQNLYFALTGEELTIKEQ